MAREEFEFDSEFDEEFSEGAARALWWASTGKKIPKGDPEDIPVAAWVGAGELKGRLEQASGVDIAVLAARAAEADGLGYEVNEIDAEEFGYYMAMEALGHGVSWEDEHAKFERPRIYMEWHALSEPYGG